MTKGKWWVVGLVLCALGSLTLAAGNGPDPMPTIGEKSVTFNDAIKVWMTAAVRVGGTPDDPVLIDCFDGMEERVPPRLQPLARALQPVSGYLVAELVNEMEYLYDAETFRILVELKDDWSPSVVALLRDAVRKAGWAPAGGFPVSGLDVSFFSAAGTGCTTGRCDCVPCDPNRVICDCKTSPLDKTQDCMPPRNMCSTSKPRRMTSPPEPLIEGLWR